MLRKYYELIKPGRTLANGMTALAGFLLAANGHIDFSLLSATIIGICLIVASACAFNNYFDRDIDVRMKRTEKRALVRGEIPAWAAVVYAAVLGAVGFGLLAAYTNVPTVILGIIGMVDYLVLYGISKRRTAYSTLIGSICGATPIAAGYTAVTGQFDAGALLLFLIMVTWQMPHFYAIAIYRQQDYAAANLPVWSVRYGIRATTIQAIAYCITFVIFIVALPLLGYASRSFLVGAGLLALIWLYKCFEGFITDEPAKWARGIFGFSLLVLLGFSALLAINPWLP